MKTCSCHVHGKHVHVIAFRPYKKVDLDYDKVVVQRNAFINLVCSISKFVVDGVVVFLTFWLLYKRMVF